MDTGVLSGVIGAAAAVVAVPVAWYYGHRTTRPSKVRVRVRVANMMPTYDLPNGGQAVGERFVAVMAANTGDCVVTISGWGVKLPGDRRMVVTRRRTGQRQCRTVSSRVPTPPGSSFP